MIASASFIAQAIDKMEQANMELSCEAITQVQSLHDQALLILPSECTRQCFLLTTICLVLEYSVSHRHGEMRVCDYGTDTAGEGHHLDRPSV